MVVIPVARMPIAAISTLPQIDRDLAIRGMPAGLATPNGKGQKGEDGTQVMPGRTTKVASSAGQVRILVRQLDLVRADQARKTSQERGAPIEEVLSTPLVEMLTTVTVGTKAVTVLEQAPREEVHRLPDIRLPAEAATAALEAGNTVQPGTRTTLPSQTVDAINLRRSKSRRKLITTRPWVCRKMLHCLRSRKLIENLPFNSTQIKLEILHRPKHFDEFKKLTRY